MWSDFSLKYGTDKKQGNKRQNKTKHNVAVRVVSNMFFFVSFCDTICVTNRNTSSDHLTIKRVRVIFSHTDDLFYGKDTFCLF